MVAPLVALAAALVSKKLQEADERRAFEIQNRKELEATNRAINDRRAQRAGDAGYMQAAGTREFSLMPESNSNQVIASVGQALMNQKQGPELKQQTQLSTADKEAVAEGLASKFAEQNPRPRYQAPIRDSSYWFPDDEQRRNGWA